MIDTKIANLSFFSTWDLINNYTKKDIPIKFSTLLGVSFFFAFWTNTPLHLF